MKVFGIGLARTGTLSLCRALEMLGYTTVHCPWSFSEIDSCDASVDTPVTLGYKFLDVMYPGSKFIFTDRDINQWLDSCYRYWGKYHNEQAPRVAKLHIHLYGQEVFNDLTFYNAYESHRADVLTTFHRRDDLLVLNICAGEGWAKLCEFLGKPVPEQPFPHEHSWEKILASEHLNH